MAAILYLMLAIPGMPRRVRAWFTAPIVTALYYSAEPRWRRILRMGFVGLGWFAVWFLAAAAILGGAFLITVAVVR